MLRILKSIRNTRNRGHRLLWAMTTVYLIQPLWEKIMDRRDFILAAMLATISRKPTPRPKRNVKPSPDRKPTPYRKGKR